MSKLGDLIVERAWKWGEVNPLRALTADELNALRDELVALRAIVASCKCPLPGKRAAVFECPHHSSQWHDGDFRCRVSMARDGSQLHRCGIAFDGHTEHWCPCGHTWDAPLTGPASTERAELPSERGAGSPEQPERVSA